MQGGYRWWEVESNGGGGKTTGKGGREGERERTGSGIPRVHVAVNGRGKKLFSQRFEIEKGEKRKAR